MIIIFLNISERMPYLDTDASLTSIHMGRFELGMWTFCVYCHCEDPVLFSFVCSILVASFALLY